MSVVTDEMVEVVAEAMWNAMPHATRYVKLTDAAKHLARRMARAALAVVAPTIAAQERERCAQVAHQHGYDLANLDERNGAFSAAAAIRALGDADE